jgi:hypothetical protein
MIAVFETELQAVPNNLTEETAFFITTAVKTSKVNVRNFHLKMWLSKIQNKFLVP